jgi:hypothetical protein
MDTPRLATLLAIALVAVAAWAQEPQEGGAQAMPDSSVIPNVPYIGANWQEKLDGPQDFMFPSAMGSVMRFLDPATDQTYRFYLDVSGMAYQQLWHPAKWDSAFDNVWALDDDPVAPIRRCFEAAGYGFRVIGNRPVCDGLPPIATALPEHADADGLREAVCASLRAGKPVIAIGLWAGAAVLAGYRDQGETMLGWTMDGEPGRLERDESGYWRFPDWLQRTQAVVLISDKREPLPMRDVCRETLVWAVQASRRSTVGEYHAGQAAFTTWAEAVRQGTNLPTEDPEQLKQAHMAHFFASLVVAEGRAFAYDALGRAADLEPTAAADIDAASDCYHLMHDLVWRLWQTRGGDGPDEEARRFAPAAVRQELAGIILRQRDLDALAVHHLARAAEAFGVRPEDLPPPSETELAAVARAEQRALTCGANRASLQRQSVDLWLGGTPVLRFGEGRDCTFIGALEAALTPTARPVPYPDLMGYSGLAFRARWMDNPEGRETAWGTLRWHPVSPHGEGPDELAALTQATGWQFRREEFPAEPDDLTRQRLITGMVVSINDGLPLVVGRNTDLTAVHGYNIHSMNFFLRDYQHPQEAELRVSDRDPGFQSPAIFLSGLRQQPSPREALLSALKTAVRNGQRPQEDGFRYGPDALQAWAQALAGYGGYTDDERNLLFLCNWWCLMHLADARRAAADFLGANTDLLPGEAGAALARAFLAYKQEAEALSVFAQQHQRFIVWWGGGAGVGQWDAEARQAQVDLLANCRALEAEGLAALGEALAGAG